MWACRGVLGSKNSKKISHILGSPWQNRCGWKKFLNKHILQMMQWWMVMNPMVQSVQQKKQIRFAGRGEMQVWLKMKHYENVRQHDNTTIHYSLINLPMNHCSKITQMCSRSFQTNSTNHWLDIPEKLVHIEPTNSRPQPQKVPGTLKRTSN